MTDAETQFSLWCWLGREARRHLPRRNHCWAPGIPHHGLRWNVSDDGIRLSCTVCGCPITPNLVRFDTCEPPIFCPCGVYVGGRGSKDRVRVGGRQATHSWLCDTCERRSQDLDDALTDVFECRRLTKRLAATIKQRTAP